MSYDTLLYKKREGIAYVTINRPEKLNALNRAVLDELQACFETIQKDQEARIVILTGAGEKAFAAGADINELAASSAISGRGISRRGQRVFDLVEDLGKPVIAAVQGYALGGGCELAMACTMRIASEHARFGQPEVKLGLIPGYGGSQRLCRLVGKGRALELALTGEPITAQEAYRIGLVNRVTPENDLMATVETLARKVMSNAPIAVTLCMQAINHAMETVRQEGELLEAALFSLCCATQDMKEGARAFLEKRPPRFVGR